MIVARLFFLPFCYHSSQMIFSTLFWWLDILRQHSPLSRVRQNAPACTQHTYRQRPEEKRCCSVQGTMPEQNGKLCVFQGYSTGVCLSFFTFRPSAQFNRKMLDCSFSRSKHLYTTSIKHTQASSCLNTGTRFKTNVLGVFVWYTPNC